MQQRALARAGGAAQREEIAAAQLQVDAAQNFERTPAQKVGLVDVPRRYEHVIHSATPPQV